MINTHIASQWEDVKRTAAVLQTLKRKYTGGMVGFYNINTEVINGPIPLFAVGFTGWAQVETIKKHCSEAKLDGILVIDKGIFVSSARVGGVVADGPWSLWGMIHSLHMATEAINATKVNILAYAQSNG